MRALLDAKIPEDTAERVRRSHAAAIEELQKTPLAAARVIKNIELEDGVVTPIAHKLSRACIVITSPPRNASTTGRIDEIRSADYDRSKYTVLQASGFGATITVDLLVL